MESAQSVGESGGLVVAILYKDKRMRLAALFAFLMLTAPTGAMADKRPVDPIATDLSRCDAEFFKTLKANAPTFFHVPGFTISGDIAYFKVPSRLSQTDSTTSLPAGVKIGAFDVSGYFDELSSMSGGGKFVAWGFILRAPINEVIKGLRPLLWQADRVRADGAIFVRSELWDHSQAALGWQAVTTGGGFQPRRGTVERVLLIEPYERDPKQTRFGCSLQGSVTNEMIAEYRPDLALAN